MVSQHDIDALKAADLNNPVNRRILADALEEAGLVEESQLVRSTPVRVNRKGKLVALTVKDGLRVMREAIRAARANCDGDDIGHVPPVETDRGWLEVQRHMTDERSWLIGIYDIVLIDRRSGKVRRFNA